MKREVTNRIRFVLEELVPPILRDSWLFRRAMSLASRGDSDRFAHFRQRAPFLTASDYAVLYQNYRHIHDETDNSSACIGRISADARGPDICDVGCGSGATLRTLAAGHRDLRRLVGVDINPPAPDQGRDIEYYTGDISALRFDDGTFDTVICTHTLEHVLDIRAAIVELRRISRQRIIIVVPMERESIYTFNPHFHFFPYVHSFLRLMYPIPKEFECLALGRDIYYREDRDQSGC